MASSNSTMSIRSSLLLLKLKKVHFVKASNAKNFFVKFEYIINQEFLSNLIVWDGNIDKFNNCR